MNIKVKEIILDNKIKLIMLPMKHTEIVSLGIFTKVGSRNEDNRTSGIAHFLEHMIFKGTKHMSSKIVAEKLDNVGAIYNAETSFETTAYSVYGNKDNINVFIDIFLDIFLNPAFKEEDIIVERGVVVEELNMNKEDPMEIIMQLLQENLFSNSSLKNPIIGTKKNIMSFTRKDFIKFRNTYYTNDRTAIVIAGNFNTKKISKRIISKVGRKKYIETIKKPLVIKDLPIQTKPELIYKEKKDLPQTNVYIAFRAESIFSKNNEVYDIISDILTYGTSSILMDLLRTKMGIVYTVFSGNLAFSHEGAFVIYMGVENNSTEKAIKAVLGELIKLKNKGINDNILDKAKKRKETQYLLKLETPHDIMNHYGYGELEYNIGVEEKNKKDYHIESTLKRYHKINKKDVDTVIKELFVPERLNIIVYGNEKTFSIKSFESEFEKM